ncbi:MAG: hypothetical protein HYW49_13350 [Deltaproteobacteria bacterium]|nr:hypothetical protein [Deltaproteobacteria bacterium]
MFKERAKIISLTALAFALAAYTQLAELTQVPGLHFDEAWQGLFAHRLATETGFHPFQAMNSYTSPVLHYLLAGVFRIFSPSLLVMRGALSAMNLAACALIAAWLWRLGERKAVPWFVLLWAVLPLSVHGHRFFVEVTSFHGFCLAVLLWGLALWDSIPAVSFLLVLGASAAGAYSHVVFIAVLIGGMPVLARAYRGRFHTPRARLLTAATALSLCPLAFRMGAGTGKFLPLALLALLFSVAVVAAAAGTVLMADDMWKRMPRLAHRSATWVPIISFPFLLAFVVLHFDGAWPYAQATGTLPRFWIPINAAIFAVCAVLEARRRPASFHTMMCWHGFLLVLLVTFAMILKPSPRFFVIPGILAMIWAAMRLSYLPRGRLGTALVAAVLAWNVHAFHHHYLLPQLQHGPTDSVFRLWFFKDSGRDFRPFQRAYAWAVEQGCGDTLQWMEDDRFLRPVEFLRLTAPLSNRACPWKKDELFFSHNPPPDKNLKLLAHFPEWGDLAFYLRK